VDNSEYMRNGDYIPSRLQAQQDAVNLVCHSKTRSNPENNVGLLTLANTEVLVTLTSDVGRILSKLHQVQPKGNVNLLSAIRIAHLALRHRQGKNHKMRIVVFIGSPIVTDEKDSSDLQLVKLAKRLKKEKVNVDVVNFGEDALNSDKLASFVNTINGKEGSGSHLVTVPPGPHLSDALLTSPIIQGEDGTGAIGLGSAAGFEFGVDPNEDPELALALRVSMEEQRQRQEEEARRAAAQSAVEAGVTPSAVTEEPEGTNEEVLLEKALAMSLAQEGSNAVEIPDFSAMTEDEQIAYAMRMSLQNQADKGIKSEDNPTPMETDDADNSKRADNEDYSEVMNDPAFLQSVLQSLPGVDPQSEAVRNAMGALSQQQDKAKKEKDDKADK